MGDLIINDHNLRAIPPKTIYRSIDELISFADLLLRWPFRSFYLVSFYAGLDTPENPFNYYLHMRLAHTIGLRRKIPAELEAARQEAEQEKKSRIVDETDIVVGLWDCIKDSMRLDTIFANADFLYFDLAEVEAVEREHPDCRIIDLAQRGTNPLFVTTPKNIREVGALTLYHWARIGGIRDERFYYRDDVLSPDKHWQMDDDIHFPEKAFRVLPKERIWPDLPTVMPKISAYKRTNDLSEPKRRIQELRRLGIREQRKLAGIIFMLFPNLTKAEIGSLLPGSEGTKTSYETDRDRGRSLLGKKVKKKKPVLKKKSPRLKKKSPPLKPKNPSF
ncbi:MAG: hypothetical protein LBV12_01170 [Puniceicoccales bacterium]|jgi:hypothetical protein|nr:hypothetical protein [Puniceicoccales bacterium]